MLCLKVRNLPWKERVPREFLLQSCEQLQSARLIFLAHIRNGKQDARKWRKIMTALGGGTQVLYSALFVGGQSSHAKDPTNRGCHAANDVFTEARRQQSVVAVVTNREQLLPLGRSLFGEMQRCQVALFDERRVIGLQAGTQR